MENCLKFFKIYFKYLKTHSTKCDQLIPQANALLSTLSDRAYVLEQISRCDNGNEIHSLFPDLGERLLGEIHSNLDVNLKSLWTIENEINNSNKELKMHLHELEVLPRPVSFDSEISGISGLNGLHPSFDDLQEMATNAWRIYNDLWMNIHAALLLFNHSDDESLKRLETAFKEDEASKAHLNYILALAAFLIED